MPRHPRADLTRVKTISIKSRKSKVTPKQFAAPFRAEKDSFAGFVRGLPDILVARDVKLLVEDITRCARKRKPVLVMLGAHVIKVGLAPVLIDLMRRQVITAVAMNSAAAIHDVETALWGKTSEDVAANMLDGRFGMARETGEFINGTLLEASRKTDQGYGEALGAALNAAKAKNRKVSVLATAHALGIPATVHAAIGTDIIHQQPSMDGGVTGEMSFRDFRTLCSVCGRFTGDGVVLNIGSAVILPEVFLKALTVARNLGAKARGFTTAVMDKNSHYRPTMNVQLRPTQDGGKGLYIIGHHEIMVPLLGAMIVSRMRHG
ncbi:MAG: hypothetical protein IT282_06275 [Bacteroidetes bacterium]|nr:hypothetical protein [Bacteroidota bacterium]